MKYLCLVYGVEADLQKMVDQHCLDYDEAIRADGTCVASEALESVSTAATVRVRNGKVPAGVGCVEVRPIRPIRESPRN
jgi:hypothetical protein